MKHPIEFSVVIPLYNKATSIVRTLESVVAQKYPAKEIIVINDGSTDKSEQTVKDLNIPNLRVVNQVNQGVSVARNNGVERARSPYIAFLDADDIWSPFYLGKMAELIQRFPQSQCYASAYQKQHEQQTFSLPKTNVAFENPHGYLLHNYFEIVANGDLPFMMSSCVFQKTFYQQIGGCPQGEVMGEDQALFAAAALRATIAFTSFILLSYRTDSENRACDRHLPAQQLPFIKRLLKETQHASKDVRRNIETYAGAIACFLAKRQISAGNVDVAWCLLKEPEVQHKPLHKYFLMSQCLLKGMLKQKPNKLERLA